MKGSHCSKVLRKRGMLGRLACVNSRKKPGRSSLIKCRSLLPNRLNFKKSGVPSRVMFFDHGSWTDFSAEAARALVTGFTNGRPTVEVKIDGSLYLVDFLRMLQIDLGSGCERSIAWIDVNEKCFFPKYFVGEHTDEYERDGSCLKLEIEIKIDPSQGSMVGNGGKGSGVDRVSVSSRMKEQDSRMIMEQGIQEGGAPKREICKRIDDLENDEAATKEEYYVDTGLSSKVKNQEPYLRNDGPAECFSPTKIPCKDSGSWNNKSCTMSPNLIKQVRLGSCLRGENVVDVADVSGVDARSSTRKRMLMNTSMDCFGTATTEQVVIDNSCPRKRVCIQNEPCGVAAAAASGVGNIAREDNLPYDAKRCFLDMNKDPRDVLDADVDPQEAAPVENDPSKCWSQPSPVGRVGGSGMKLLLDAVESVSDKKPIVSVCNPQALQDPRFGGCGAEFPPRFASLGAQLAKLKDGGRAYVTVRNLFLKGLGKIGAWTTVNSIYWCSRTSPWSNTRFHTFQRHIEMMKRSRDNANVKYAWHGTSAEGVESIVLHGFGQPSAGCGPESYGVGIYLSPEGQSHLSVSCAEPDHNGEQHMLLCRVILGNMEQVEPGSCQCHPSNENFDSGVDDLTNPRHYIIWSTHMNAHILPEYILSFSLPNHLKGLWKETNLVHDFCLVNDFCHPPVNISPLPEINCSSRLTAQTVGPEKIIQAPRDINGGTTKKNSSLMGIPNMSFPELFSIMERCLPQSSVQILNDIYHEYKAGKVAKEIFVRKIRSIVGDKLLINTIRSIRDQV